MLDVQQRLSGVQDEGALAHRSTLELSRGKVRPAKHVLSKVGSIKKTVRQRSAGVRDREQGSRQGAPLSLEAVMASPRLARSAENVRGATRHHASASSKRRSSPEEVAEEARSDTLTRLSASHQNAAQGDGDAVNQASLRNIKRIGRSWTWAYSSGGRRQG